MAGAEAAVPALAQEKESGALVRHCLRRHDFAQNLEIGAIENDPQTVLEAPAE